MLKAICGKQTLGVDFQDEAGKTRALSDDKIMDTLNDNKPLRKHSKNMNKILSCLPIAITLLTTNTISFANEKRSVETITGLFGELKVDSPAIDTMEDEPHSFVYLNDKKIFSTDWFLRIRNYFGDNNIFLLNHSLGGNSCAGDFVILRIVDRNTFKISDKFGNCNAPIITENLSGTEIYFPKNESGETVKAVVDMYNNISIIKGNKPSKTSPKVKR